jgi:hypothetical protein
MSQIFFRNLSIGECGGLKTTTTTVSHLKPRRLGDNELLGPSLRKRLLFLLAFLWHELLRVIDDTNEQ